MNCIKPINPNEKQPSNRLTTAHKKTAHLLASSIKFMCDKFGIENVAFLTLTFSQHVTNPKEAQRRLNSLFTNVIKKRYGDYVGVFERQKSGRIHYHLLVNIGFDIRTGFNFDDIAKQNYKSASGKLRSEWSFWREIAPRYGFGRTELMPIKSTSEGIGRYVGKYISKNIEQREDKQDKGVRLVRYSNGVRAGNTKFMFVSDGSKSWRRKVALFARILSMKNGGIIVDSIDDIRDLCGKKWAYYNREFILGLPDCSDITDAEINSFFAVAAGEGRGDELRDIQCTRLVRPFSFTYLSADDSVCTYTIYPPNKGGGTS